MSPVPPAIHTNQHCTAAFLNSSLMPSVALLSPSPFYSRDNLQDEQAAASTCTLWAKHLSDIPGDNDTAPNHSTFPETNSVTPSSAQGLCGCSPRSTLWRCVRLPKKRTQAVGLSLPWLSTATSWNRNLCSSWHPEPYKQSRSILL